MSNNTASSGLNFGMGSLEDRLRGSSCSRSNVESLSVAACTIFMAEAITFIALLGIQLCSDLHQIDTAHHCIIVIRILFHDFSHVLPDESLPSNRRNQPIDLGDSLVISWIVVTILWSSLTSRFSPTTVDRGTFRQIFGLEILSRLLRNVSRIRPIVIFLKVFFFLQRQLRIPWLLSNPSSLLRDRCRSWSLLFKVPRFSSSSFITVFWHFWAAAKFLVLPRFSRVLGLLSGFFRGCFCCSITDGDLSSVKSVLKGCYWIANERETTTLVEDSKICSDCLSFGRQIQKGILHRIWDLIAIVRIILWSSLHGCALIDDVAQGVKEPLSYHRRL